MSREQHEDEKKKKDAPVGEVGRAAAEGGDGETLDKPKLPLFKIVPVDPKNSFDFEDVADK